MNIKIQANPTFKEVNNSQKRYIVMKGSAGSGKSVDTAQNYILRLMQDKGRNLVALRKSDITNRDSTFAELTGAIYRMFGCCLLSGFNRCGNNLIRSVYRAPEFQFLRAGINLKSVAPLLHTCKRVRERSRKTV